MTEWIRRAEVALVLLVSIVSPGFADDAGPANHALFPTHSSVWERVTFPPRTPAAAPEPAAQTSPPPRVAPVEYSDGYKTRARIHRYASFAMLPLAATEIVLGQSLYDTPSDGKRSAHLVVGTSIGVLFGVNTVTGAWNLWEGRKDPNGRKRRFVHAVLMMAADAGFLATAATGPENEEESGEREGSRSTHRALAITSLATATAGYLIMLFGGH